MRRPSAEPLASPADFAACREAIRGGSRTFYAASLLLPPRLRGPAYALYAFCRASDDAVDEGADPAAAVVRLRARLEHAAAGRPLDHPCDRAFAATLHAHAIPPALPAALLEGLAWDAEARRYETLADLRTYAARVAGTVGAMMTLLMGPREPAVLARACDLGVAMQLTNIARDVGEDARAGRLYLPRAWMREAGLDPDAFLAAPAMTPALDAVVTRLLAEADALYARSRPGIDRLPRRCRPAIQAARVLYAEIGRAVDDPIARRAVVPASRKLWLLAPALAAAARPARADGLALEALPETRFLVDAVTAAPASLTVDQRQGAAEWTIDLFLELARRERAASAP